MQNCSIYLSICAIPMKGVESCIKISLGIRTSIYRGALIGFSRQVRNRLQELNRFRRLYMVNEKRIEFNYGGNQIWKDGRFRQFRNWMLWRQPAAIMPMLLRLSALTRNLLHNLKVFDPGRYWRKPVPFFKNFLRVGRMWG